MFQALNRFFAFLSICIVHGFSWCLVVTGWRSSRLPIVKSFFYEELKRFYSCSRHWLKTKNHCTIVSWLATNSSTIPYRYTFNAANLVSRLLISDKVHTWNNRHLTGSLAGDPWRWRVKCSVLCFHTVHKNTPSVAEYFKYFVEL